MKIKAKEYGVVSACGGVLILSASEDLCLKKGGSGKIKTDISVEIPNGYVGKIFLKEDSVLINRGLHIFSEIFFPKKMQNINVTASNTTEKSLFIRKGEEICCLSIEKNDPIGWEFVKEN